MLASIPLFAKVLPKRLSVYINTHNQEFKILITSMKLLHVLVVILITCSYAYAITAEKGQQKKTYIVHMDKSSMPLVFDDHVQWYESSIKTVSDSARMMYIYTDIIHGFSTRMTAEDAQSLEQQPGILLVQEEMRYELHTTRTPGFLGLEKSGVVYPGLSAVSEVIVGVLDTGVWPESQSFDDSGLGPVPSSWKGECETASSFNSSSCNRKLIGARSFSKGYEAAYGPVDETVESNSPRDDDGHGTHTSTTAAGSAVSGANLFGYAAGTARGMAAQARVAIYKVCWHGGCFSSDILAAMEKAITDGVNVLSLSLGGSVSDYYRDTISIGAFTAMVNGIFVSCSAGNGGPSSESLSNVAPWIATVGAGTLDRDFPAYATVGSGKNFSGASLYSGKSLSGALVSLVYAGKDSNTSANLCLTGTLDPKEVAGKIVVCDRGMSARAQKSMVVRDAGGVGLILTNTDSFGEEIVADAHLIPSVAVGQIAGDAIKTYISTDSNPTATITSGGTHLGIQPSPLVAAFSSRGPNPITPELLKPDFIAPGINIIAGWSGKVGPSGLTNDSRRVSFNIISGTSMSCPHASGLAALIKAAHPEWSPSAIRSALMTTSYNKYKNGAIIQDIATGKPSTPFDIGSGHVDPVSALDPGLVYDATVEDYVDFLCALNYSSSQIKAMTKRSDICKTDKKYIVGDLNYPSFAVTLQTALGKGNGDIPTIVKYTRTLTNVGKPSAYKVSVSSEASNVKIVVEPEALLFSKPNEKKSYTVTFSATSMPSGTTKFARLEWLGGKYIVGSPIALSWM